MKIRLGHLSFSLATMLLASVGAGLAAGCAATSTVVYRNPNFDQNKVYRVAVFPFRDAAGCPGSGETMSSIFETTLLASGKAEVVERSEIERIIRERHPGKTGPATGIGISEVSSTNSTSVSVHPEYADYSAEFDDPVALGKLARADLVVVGKVSNWFHGNQGLIGVGAQKTTVGASIRAISVEKGIVVWSIDKAAEPDFIVMPLDAPVDVVARKLCRQMISDFVGSKK